MRTRTGRPLIDLVAMLDALAQVRGLAVDGDAAVLDQALHLQARASPACASACVQLGRVGLRQQRLPIGRSSRPPARRRDSPETRSANSCCSCATSVVGACVSRRPAAGIGVSGVLVLL